MTHYCYPFLCLTGLAMGRGKVLHPQLDAWHGCARSCRAVAQIERARPALGQPNYFRRPATDFRFSEFA